MITFFSHQEKLVEMSSDTSVPFRHLLAHQTGSGKSITALAIAKQRACENILVICPKTLKLGRKWDREFALLDFPSTAAFTVVSKEEFRRDYKSLPKYDCIIADEAHYFANVKSQLHKALLLYVKVHNPDTVLLLTATPYTSSPMSIYALSRILSINDTKKSLDYFKFRERFFVPRYFGSRVVFEPRPGIEDELADVVRQMGSIVRLEDCIDIPEQTFIEEKYPMSSAQIKAKKQVDETETNPLTRFGKYHQIASGILKGNEYVATETFEALKNRRVVEYALDNDKMIVVANFTDHLHLLKNMLEAEKIPVLMLSGETKDKGTILADAEHAPRMVLLVQASMAVGWEAPSFDLMVFAGLSYSLVHYIQSLGRMLRIDNPKKNTYVVLSTEGSADEPVKQAMDEKRDFDAAIFIRSHIETLNNN